MTYAMPERVQNDRRTIEGYECRLVDAPLAGRRPDGTTLRIYELADPERHIDRAALLREAVVEEPPYWTLVWIGARAIAETILANPSRHGASVCDLGCGLGLAGLAAASVGSRVTFCDRNEACLRMVQASAAANGFGEVDTRALDFTTDTIGCRFDSILAADIVYDPDTYEGLAGFLDLHLNDSGEILLTESLRADARLFLERLSARGFVDRKEAIWIEEEGRRERTWLHRLRRARRHAAGKGNAPVQES